MTFYFYDLETSGISARAQRIMQFAGQRTDENLQPIGEPQNFIVKLTDEILPDPEAILITGITPQKSLEEGYNEAEFLKLFSEQVLQPDTIVLGFNSVHFDDEFMRFTLWRNFYDPYQWQYQNGRTRWDLLDVVRMVRALRPEGIEWPFEEKEGKKQPTNRLELITDLNGLDHQNAHDALSDVQATIAVAKLLKEKQPKMFDYLLKMRSKQAIKEVCNPEDPQPFVYTSGRYSSRWEKTTVVVPIGLVLYGNVLVYDLRLDPEELMKLSDEEFSEAAFSRNEETEILPLKVLKPGSCPAVAPLGVLDEATQKRLDLSLADVEKNYKKLLGMKALHERILAAYEQYDAKRKKLYETKDQQDDPDFQLYDGFVQDKDKSQVRAVQSMGASDLADFHPMFHDARLETLLPRYKARNYPKTLTSSEQEAWEAYRSERLVKGVVGQLPLDQFVARIAELAQSKTDEESQFLLQELQLYAQSIVPTED